jgi:hypothetical protein
MKITRNHLQAGTAGNNTGQAAAELAALPKSEETTTSKQIRDIRPGYILKIKRWR